MTSMFADDEFLVIVGLALREPCGVQSDNSDAGHRQV
jgi:hypothetical protein